MTPHNAKDSTRGNANRRNVLQAIGAGIGLTGIGFSTTAKANNGEKTIVHTRDTDGEPDKVRVVPEERYNRIKAFLSITKEDIVAPNKVISGLRLEQASSDETDLVIQVLLNENKIDELETFETPEADNLQEVPTEFVKVDASEPTYKDGCHEGDYFTSMRGNMEIGVDDESMWGDDENVGTSAFVAEDPGSSDPCIITAAHVVEPRDNKNLYQPSPSNEDSRVIGEFVEESPKEIMDVAKYRLEYPEYSKYATADLNQEDITGTWDFEGIVDRTTNDNPIPCTFAGHMTCGTDTHAVDATRNMALDYQVNYDDQISVGGDSGGPFVDWNGKLVGTLSGEMQVDGSLCDFGPSGTELLQYINAAPPS